ncbi:uncharacterized protein LOC127804980 [Diospyros lotus]|uniref:uncharacterized protein LOC127804980 n=1 Tax=Diospyros lotus TaxID=55363 RepID=UPI0022586F62|nr:uncharacterized protein LOC127804980 [Diospyros lotus]
MFIPRFSHFDWVIMGSTTQFLCRKLLLFLRIFWFAASAFFRRYLLSSEENTTRSDISFVEKTGNGSSPNEPEPELCPQIDAEAEAEQDAVGFVADGFGQKETSEFSFEFKFPTFEEFSRSRKENGDSISFGETNKYEFMPMKSCSRFVEEPETVSFAEGRSTDKDFVQISSEAKAVVEEVPQGQENVAEKIEAMAFEEEKGKETDALDEHDSFDQGEKEDSSTLDSDSGSISSSPLRLILNRLIDSYSDGFLSDGDFREEFELDNLAENNGDEVELHDELSDLDENYLDYSSKVHKEDGFHGEEEDTYTMEELRKLEEAHLQNVGKLSSDFLSEKDFRTEEDNPKNEEHGKKPAETTADSGKVSSKNSSDWDSEDSNKLESLWEHQELIEQLKMELKKVRATGLPTILEESESPKISEDLKPWKIDEKFQHADRMDELHKLYKSYRERMRKFDILNYQKMYAIGFLQLKDPLQSVSNPKSSVPSFGSIFSQSLFPSKRKKIGSDPMMKFVKELQGDLEVVYVGQMCLSWEILHWQYEKALELWESDPRGIRQFNEVAGEFQQFQVLVQRFTEDEPFQGPRVQNYVKTRCVLRNLLQVPVIREDSAKDRKKAMKRREGGDDDYYSITSDMLVEIMEESIRIFWRFVRADKYCSTGAAAAKCGRRGSPHPELQDPQDAELLMELRTNLRKKERKLKELLRSGNCILKRLRRSEEEESEQVLYFFSQVDMKLVARVLNMSRITTEQLIWCRNKLSTISFVNSKIRIDPSFFLFPC